MNVQVGRGVRGSGRPATETSCLTQGAPYGFTPDALATLTLPDGDEAVVFIEVDLASMTQAVLKQKVARYLAYASDLVWQDHYPYCPPMLLFTTTATRAVSFARAAGQVLATHRADDNDPAARLVVAASGQVRDPATAVIEPCWTLLDTAGADPTLAEVWPSAQNTCDLRRAVRGWDRPAARRGRCTAGTTTAPPPLSPVTVLV